MPEMRNPLILSLLMLLAMVCSCEKRDSTAEQQFAKRKAELDATENALNERMDALDERLDVLNGRVNALIEKDQTAADARTVPTQVQRQIRDPVQPQAEAENTMQQIPAETSSLVTDDRKIKAEREKTLRAQNRTGMDRLQSRQRKLEMTRRAASSSAETASPGSSPTPQ